MNIMGKIMPRESGKATVAYYRDILLQKEHYGVISRPDIAKVRFGPIHAELQIYKGIINQLLEKHNRTKVDAELLFTAADMLSTRIANPGTSNYIFGLRPGSDDPIHFGHISAGLAAILHLRSGNIPINGVIFATGGKVPDKPEISAFVHREAMVDEALKGFGPWLSPSSVRNMTAEELSKQYIVQNRTKYYIMGGTPEEQRSYCDIAAFNLLFALNPSMQWYYITGSDKVNKYGLANERELVFNTLYKHKIKVLYFERDDQPVQLEFIRKQPWLQKMWDEGMFIRSDISSYSDLSATKLRGMLVGGDPKAGDELHTDEIKYINEKGLLELYKFNTAVKNGSIARDSDEYKKQIKQFRDLGLID